MPKAFVLFILIQVFTVMSAHAQLLRGVVYDDDSGAPLAFVAISVAGTSQGVYTDIDGNFEIQLQNTPVTLYCVYIGYQTKEIQITDQQYLRITMERKNLVLGEVKILPGENPADRIMRRVIKNKDKNNPEKNYSFRYDSYNKLVVTGITDSARWLNPDNFNSLDSNTQETVSFFNSQHIFLLESISRRKFLPPDHSEEEVIANRVSGLSNPEFALLASQLQSFSFYQESIFILGQQYLSPLCDEALKKYLFMIEDTTYQDNDTVYTLSYQPRKGKNFEGIQGQLFINTRGYALQNVIAEPKKGDNSFTIRIQQQYKLYQDSIWFPEQLNSNIKFLTIQIPGWHIVGIGKSYIKNLRFDEPYRAKDFSPITLQISSNASLASDSLWNAYREVPLDTKEKTTYHVIDSVAKEAKLDRLSRIMRALATGQIPLGPINFDIDKLYRFNNYEGSRLGVGVHTNDRVSKILILGGYWGYGFKDKRQKYGGDLQININRQRAFWIKGAYHKDLQELGGNQFEPPAAGGLFIRSLYPLFLTRMDWREKYEVSMNCRFYRTLSALAFVNQQFIDAYKGYRFASTEGEAVVSRDRFQTAETGLTLRWAPGEKLIRTSQREITLGGRFPVIFGSVTTSRLLPKYSTYQYTRFDGQIEKTFKTKLAGSLKVHVVGGYTTDRIPLSMLYNARGTYNSFSIEAPLTFMTMRVNEFQHNQYVAVHLRHDFGKLLYNRPKFAPQFSLVHQMMWGRFDFPQDHSFSIRDTRKGYFESGIMINNLLKNKNTFYGLGAMYRYGPYELEQFRDNISIRLTSSFVF